MVHGRDSVCHQECDQGFKDPLVPGRINNGKGPSTYFQHLKFQVSNKYLGGSKTEQGKKVILVLYSRHNPEHHKAPEMFSVLRENKYDPTITYSATQSFKYNRGIFSDVQGLRIYNHIHFLVRLVIYGGKSQYHLTRFKKKKIKDFWWLRIHLPRHAHGFSPWSGKIPHAEEQPRPCATITEACEHQSPCLATHHCNKSIRDNQRVAPLATTGENPCAAKKTQHSQ